MSEKRVMRIKRGLMKSAKKLRLGAKRTGAYVYGTLRRIVGNPASPRSLAKLMALEKDGTTRYSSAYLMSAKNAFDRGQGAEFQRLILTRMRKERGRDVDMRRLAGNPMRSSFDKPTFGPGQAEYRRVDTTTMAGIKEAERLQRAGWYQAQATPFSTTFYRRKIRKNPPMYAHGMTAHRTHGLSLKQMMKLYRLVSSGNPKAVMYARRTLGIPMSESLSQVKAVVYHHVMDLKGKI